MQTVSPVAALAPIPPQTFPAITPVTASSEEATLTGLLVLTLDLVAGAAAVLMAVYFARGVFLFYAAKGDKKRRAKGKKVMATAAIGAVAVIAARVFVELVVVPGLPEAVVT